MKKIEIPRHPDLGVTITIVFDSGKSYYTNQKVVSDHVLQNASNELENLFGLYLDEMRHEMIEYLVKIGAIERPN
jgi:hypothetical protein